MSDKRISDADEIQGLLFDYTEGLMPDELADQPVTVPLRTLGDLTMSRDRWRAICVVAMGLGLLVVGIMWGHLP